MTISAKQRGLIFLSVGLIGFIVWTFAAPQAFAGESKAIAQMAMVFKGSPSKTEVKKKVDAVLSVYDVPATEEEYNRVGSMLVVLRKETGVPEMDILDCMLGKGSSVRVLSNDAAYCAMMLE